MADNTTDTKTTTNKKTDDTKAPDHVLAAHDGVATITAVNPNDSGEIARRLLDAADTPDQVRTITAPHGWKVPEAIAKKAGLKG